MAPNSTPSCTSAADSSLPRVPTSTACAGRPPFHCPLPPPCPSPPHLKHASLRPPPSLPPPASLSLLPRAPPPPPPTPPASPELPVPPPHLLDHQRHPGHAATGGVQQRAYAQLLDPPHQPRPERLGEGQGGARAAAIALIRPSQGLIHLYVPPRVPPAGQRYGQTYQCQYSGRRPRLNWQCGSFCQNPLHPHHNFSYLPPSLPER